MQGEQSPEGWIAAGAALGAVVSKIIGFALRKFFSESTNLKKELKEMRRELREVQEQIDHWKGRYWSLHEENAKLRAELARFKVEFDSILSSRDEAARSRLPRN